MRRRSLCLWVAASVGWPAMAHAQRRKTARIGVLSDTARSDPAVELMFTRLAELGWSEIRNLTVEYVVAEPGVTDLAPMVAALVKSKCDLILASGTPAAMAVKTGAPSTPMVFAVGGDPVALGLVASLARPGGRATGVTHISPESGVKQLSLLRDVAPRAARVAVLFEVGNPSMEQVFATIATQPGAQRMALRAYPVEGGRDVDAAEAAIVGDGVDGLIVLSDRVTGSYRSAIIGIAQRRRLPAVYGSRYFVEAGGLLSYGINWPAQFSRTADFVARILDGAKPADIPVEQPTKFELLLNLKTARSQGIAVPQAVLLQATEVIR